MGKIQGGETSMGIIRGCFSVATFVGVVLLLAVVLLGLALWGELEKAVYREQLIPSILTVLSVLTVWFRSGWWLKGQGFHGGLSDGLSDRRSLLAALYTVPIAIGGYTFIATWFRAILEYSEACCKNDLETLAVFTMLLIFLLTCGASVAAAWSLPSQIIGSTRRFHRVEQSGPRSGDFLQERTLDM